MFPMVVDIDSLDIDVPSIDQVGIVVEDLEDGMDRIGTMFGIDEWVVFDFEPPRLQNVEFRGEPSDTTWKICLATVGEVDIELLEPVSGENTYTEHLEEYGEGIHHVACFEFDDPEAALDRYRDAGVEVLQRGDFADGTFWYLDTREAFNGVILEIVTLGEGIPDPDRVYEV